MDWQLRIAFIVIGAIIIGFIIFDYKRRKKAQIEKQRLIEQMHAAVKQSDGSGFDHTGVGNVRRFKVEPEISEGEIEVKKTPPTEPEETQKATVSKTKSMPTQQIKIDAVDDAKPQSTQAKQPELVISLILKAPEGETYSGKDFMPLLLSQGLRHGDMGIFHRHSGVSGKPGPVMYSVANALKPGTFDLKNIERFETPAFAFFISLPGPSEPIAAFEGMVKTIKLLKEELGGQILDDSRSVYTEQTYQHQLDNLREYLVKATLKQPH